MASLTLFVFVALFALSSGLCMDPGTDCDGYAANGFCNPGAVSCNTSPIANCADNVTLITLCPDCYATCIFQNCYLFAGESSTPLCDEAALPLAGDNCYRVQCIVSTHCGRPLKDVQVCALFQACYPGTCQLCNPGYNGATCQFSRVDDCSDQGQVNADGSCNCDDGFDGLDCSNVTSSSPVNCENGGISDGSGECECVGNFAGAACQLNGTLICNGNGLVDDDGNCECIQDWQSAPYCNVFDSASTVALSMIALVLSVIVAL